MEVYYLIGVSAVLLTGIGFWVLLRPAKTSKVIEKTETDVSAPLTEAKEVSPPPAAVAEPPKVGLSARLGKTRDNLARGLSSFFSRGNAPLEDKEWDELEEALLAGDVGVVTTGQILQKVREEKKRSDQVPLKELVSGVSEGLFLGLQNGAPSLADRPKPYVLSIVGINGVGKTTTIGKLAHYFKQAGQSVLLGAADTFRAGAINQLKVWSDRVGTDFVTGREAADPGAVTFDSLTAAKARGTDIVLIDTAGRLHTKTNLMEELKKIHRVMKKVIPEAPHETWLVIDGTLGQNSIQQAKEFQKALDLTGVIVTKLDGTAKGGAVLSIAADLKLPIRFIGIGETAEDLIPFQPKPFVDALFG